jgi:von Willebrand factor type D domain
MLHFLPTINMNAKFPFDSNPMLQAQTTYSFKCGTVMFMCGDGLKQENVCSNPASDRNDVYVPMSLGDCAGMIDAVKSGKPYGAKCPVYNKKSLGISHYVEYKGCNLASGTKYDNYVASACACPGGTCGPSNCGGGGSVGGDPHFRTHDGTLYSFHGECDLVMARSSSFSNGLGLDVHARTEMIGNTWSLVSNAAVRIGNDVFEVRNNGTHYINGVADVLLPTVITEAYEIHYAEEQVSDGENSIRSWYTIKLGNSDKVQITNYKKMISVNVEVKVSDMVGMLGSSRKPGLVGRDGETALVDADEMGSQWQVNDEEPMLFNEIRSPQYPETCKLPEVSMRHRRLRAANEGMSTKAKAACHGVAENLYTFCLYDVLISGNVALASTYTGGVF